jgi:hypothetical protein
MLPGPVIVQQDVMFSVRFVSRLFGTPVFTGIWRTYCTEVTLHPEVPATSQMYHSIPWVS